MPKFMWICQMLWLALLQNTLHAEKATGLTNGTFAAPPQINAQFFSADAVQLIPKIQHLDNQDLGFNKIVLQIKNYPVNAEIAFEIKRLASPHPDQYQLLTMFTVQADGTLVTREQQQLKNLLSSSKGFLPGERVTYRLRALDGTVTQEVAGIPVPVVIKDDHNQVALRAELISVDPTVYAIDLPTMEEGEEYKLRAVTLGETFKAKATFEKEKPIHFAPTTKRKNKGGMSVLEIKRHSGEAYAIRLPWGTALEPYLKGERTYPTRSFETLD